MKTTVVDIVGVQSIVAARRAVRELAAGLEFSVPDQTRLATAVSELTRNVVQYAGRGKCTVHDESSEGVRRVGVVVEDEGPGIPDIEQALQHGFSTGGGLGAGLPCTKRLVHEMTIESRPGRTRVYVTLCRSSAGATSFGRTAGSRRERR